MNLPNGARVGQTLVLPASAGKVFYVKASGGSDGHDGLSPERALNTLDYAIGLCTADAGDMIVMLDGAHSYSTTIAADVAGITITGLPGGNPQRRRASIASSASDEVITVSAANVEIANLHIICTTAQGGIELTDGADNTYIHDCSFDMFTAAASTSTIGIQSIGTSGGVKNLVVENCYFESLDAQGPYMDLNDVSYATITNVTSRHTGATALADAYVSATGAVDVLFDNFRIVAGTGAAITDSFDWTGNTTDGSLQLRNVYMSLSVGVPNASADADVWVVSSSETAQTAAGGSAPVNVLNAG
jgi:hypothetical protein